MFRVKICGITSVEDALLAAEAGADAIGLNFYDKSPRFVTPELGREIEWQIRKWDITVTGVVVNAGFEGIVDLQLRVGLDAIQLHGDEPASIIHQLRVRRLLCPARLISSGWRVEPVTLIRGVRCRDQSLDDAVAFLDACTATVPQGYTPVGPDAILIDAFDPASYGGTGKKLDWHTLNLQCSRVPNVPFILAGGLTHENVAEAIATARPDAVDVASGVESAPGKKDPAKVRAFVQAAKKAFAAIDG